MPDSVKQSTVYWKNKKEYINIDGSILEVIQVDFGEENWVSGTAVEGKIFRIYTSNFLNLNQVVVLTIFKN